MYSLWKHPSDQVLPTETKLGEKSPQGIFFFFNLFILLLFIFGCIGSFVAVCSLSLVAASWGYSSLQCAGFSLSWLLLLRSMGSRRAASVVVARGLSSCGTGAQ